MAVSAPPEAPGVADPRDDTSVVSPVLHDGPVESTDVDRGELQPAPLPAADVEGPKPLSKEQVQAFFEGLAVAPAAPPVRPPAARDHERHVLRTLLARGGSMGDLSHDAGGVDELDALDTLTCGPVERRVARAGRPSRGLSAPRAGAKPDAGDCSDELADPRTRKIPGSRTVALGDVGVGDATVPATGIGSRFGEHPSRPASAMLAAAVPATSAAPSTGFNTDRAITSCALRGVIVSTPSGYPKAA